MSDINTFERIDHQREPSPALRQHTMSDDCVAYTNAEHALLPKGPRGLSSKAAEIRRFNPPVEIIGTFESANAHLELLRFSKHNSAELEFLMPVHLIIILSEGISTVCEWTNGHQTQRLPSLAPNTVMFNPAQNYLRIRTNLSKDNCRMLVLAIQPALMSCRSGLEIDLAAVQFQQQIGLNDEGVCQALIAMRQEIETPGISSAFYIDTLLFLLLTRLIRCASNLAPPRLPTFAKGGLPNWRLKRAIEILEGDPAKVPSLSEVARLIGLHPTSFCRGFKQSTGSTPHRYLLAHRVNRAKEMMNDPRPSLTEIALDCGFGSSSRFSVVFKRITGVSPRDFRRAL